MMELDRVDMPDDATASLTATVGAVEPAAAERALADEYGLVATAQPLRGERDSNFRVMVGGVPAYVLRIANAAEPDVVGDFRAAALQHIERRAPDLPVPRLRLTSAGFRGFRLACDDGRRVGQLVGYLDGTPVAGLGRGAEQARQLGDVAARMALALQGFDHPGARHALLWDIGQAAQARAYVDHTRDGADAAIVRRVFETFAERVRPVLGGLRAQVIHNDLNPHNILVSGDGHALAGIIDFGDLVHSALANDVAVACSYLIGEGGDPLARLGDFLRAYCRVLPLERRELDLLPDLIATRLALTVVITNWRASLYPDNAAYILRNQKGALDGLRVLSALSPGAARDELTAAAMEGAGG